jgi:glycosyltransferase involved in cell wall biosynthesis
MTDQNFCILINSLTRGGAEKTVATLLLEFQQQGLKVPLICLEKNDVQIIESAQITYLSDQTGESEGAFKKFVSLFMFARKLKKYTRNNNIELVQSHIYRANYVNVLARMLGSKHKTQLVNHGIPEQYSKGGLAGRINQLLIRWLYPRADQVICPSLDMIKSLKKMGVRNDKLVHISNPVDIDEIQYMAKQEVINDVFEFELGKKYLIAVGRLEAVKRTEDIIKAFAALAEIKPELDLILLGSGSEEHKLRNAAKELNVASRVHLLGYVVNPYQYLARSELFISASENEGFSLVIVEALALGLPVVSSDCSGGPREILASGGLFTNRVNKGEVKQVTHGIFFRTGDVKGLILAINMLLNDVALKERYARLSGQQAQNFDKKATASRYLKNTHQLMGAC